MPRRVGETSQKLFGGTVVDDAQTRVDGVPPLPGPAAESTRRPRYLPRADVRAKPQAAGSWTRRLRATDPTSRRHPCKNLASAATRVVLTPAF